MVIITDKTTSYNVVFENQGYQVTIEEEFLGGGVNYVVYDDAGNELPEGDLKLKICEYVVMSEPINSGVLTDIDIEKAGGENYDILESE